MNARMSATKMAEKHFCLPHARRRWILFSIKAYDTIWKEANFIATSIGGEN